MPSANPTRAGLRRLTLNLSVAWATIWAIGVGTLALVAVQMSERLRDEQMIGELALRATAAYGLTWIDEQGRFHDELFWPEVELFDGFADLWVVRPVQQATALEIFMQPVSPRFDLSTLADVASQVVREESSLSVDGVDSSGRSFRLHAIPTYRDGADEQPYAAIVAIGDPQPGDRAHAAFTRRIALLAVAIGAVGLLAGFVLVRRSLRPALVALENGERFLVAAAHELRTPVATLRAVCESGLAGDEATETALGRAARVAEKTGEVVDDLLLFSRLDSGKAALERQDIRLDLLVEAAVPDDLSVVLNADETIVHADPRLLRVAIRNLLENATLHGNGGQTGGVILVSVSSDGIRVDDEGPGFPPAILALARERFSMAPSQRGAGIGLATCKMIAELHGGSLLLENLPEKGARAEFRLGVS